MVQGRSPEEETFEGRPAWGEEVSERMFMQNIPGREKSKCRP